ncbi:dihydrofolate reductase family protein [Shouchella clausii]|uniref:dihydrofolate reductase family protein n=1 Tax=Shouchella clausii TaxID=79880 RepID=UPI003C74E3A0
MLKYALFAGANIAQTFMKHDLIDEYRLIVNPVLLDRDNGYLTILRKANTS